jgi:hypothetical protein
MPMNTGLIVNDIILIYVIDKCSFMLNIVRKRYIV